MISTALGIYGAAAFFLAFVPLASAPYPFTNRRPIIWAAMYGAVLLWPAALTIAVVVCIAAFLFKLPSWIRGCFHALTKEIETEIAEETTRDA